MIHLSVKSGIKEKLDPELQIIKLKYLYSDCALDIARISVMASLCCVTHIALLHLLKLLVSEIHNLPRVPLSMTEFSLHLSTDLNNK